MRRSAGMRRPWCDGGHPDARPAPMRSIGPERKRIERPMRMAGMKACPRIRCRAAVPRGPCAAELEEAGDFLNPEERSIVGDGTHAIVRRSRRPRSWSGVGRRSAGTQRADTDLQRENSPIRSRLRQRFSSPVRRRRCARAANRQWAGWRKPGSTVPSWSTTFTTSSTTQNATLGSTAKAAGSTRRVTTRGIVSQVRLGFAIPSASAMP
jgi:hypothetical protein